MTPNQTPGPQVQLDLGCDTHPTGAPLPLWKWQQRQYLPLRAVVMNKSINTRETLASILTVSSQPTWCCVYSFTCMHVSMLVPGRANSLVLLFINELFPVPILPETPRVTPS